MFIISNMGNHGVSSSFILSHTFIVDLNMYSSPTSVDLKIFKDIYNIKVNCISRNITSAKKGRRIDPRTIQILVSINISVVIFVLIQAFLMNSCKYVYSQQMNLNMSSAQILSWLVAIRFPTTSSPICPIFGSFFHEIILMKVRKADMVILHHVCFSDFQLAFLEPIAGSWNWNMHFYINRSRRNVYKRKLLNSNLQNDRLQGAFLTQGVLTTQGRGHPRRFPPSYQGQCRWL